MYGSPEMEKIGNYKLRKVSDFIYEIEKDETMNVPVRIFASENILNNLKNDNSIIQAINVSKLPGIIDASIMMPDAHQGYGFSIGGVAAFDINNGIITPGGIGFDINCGVRLLRTSLSYYDVESKIDDILRELFNRIPSGVGVDSKIRLGDEIDEVLENGSEWVLKNGYAVEEDLEFTEENGRIKNADASLVSLKAKARGKRQLGTLGSGNHFLEIQIVDKVFDKDIAEAFGLVEGNIVIMIHCGSRGLGHQVCSDYLKKMEDEFPEIVSKLPERDLVYAPLSSSVARDYIKAMNSAANYAWANRQMITHNVRMGLKKFFADVNVSVVYDVAHNIAKVEKHLVNGKERELVVHRKGATRAFPKGHKEVPEKYRNYGQPVIIPGSMGTSSYVLVGLDMAMQLSFGSSAHGAGRVMSRFKANKKFDADEIKNNLMKRNIHILSASKKGISEEAPDVYKDIDDVIKVTSGAGISKIVAKLVPFGVIKG